MTQPVPKPLPAVSSVPRSAQVAESMKGATPRRSLLQQAIDGIGNAFSQGCSGRMV